MEQPTTIDYNGTTYRRYPNADQRSHRVYYQHHGVWTKTPTYLHRQVWEDNFGPIPDGYHIHHTDGDPFNNDPSNLECLTDAEHKRRHAEQGDFNSNAEHLANIRPLASEWHRSVEGREWHREHGRKTWENKAEREFTCACCGDVFKSRHAGEVLYCSHNCGMKARNQAKIGESFINVSCNICGKEFRAKKYNPPKYCSTACGWVARKAVGPDKQRTCPVCSQEFRCYGNAKYCSGKCNDKAKWQRKRQRSEPAPPLD